MTSCAVGTASLFKWSSPLLIAMTSKRGLDHTESPQCARQEPRQGSQYFRRAKSRREYAARGFRFSLFRLNSKWEERELKGNLGRRIVARWHAFSPGRNAEMPAVGRVSPANSRRRSAARGYRLCSFDGHPAERHPFCPKADRYQRAEAPSRPDAGSQTLNACATCR